MKARLALRCCVYVLCGAPLIASAAEPSLGWATRRIEQGLLEPLAKQGRGKRFSRARPAPRARHVRLTQERTSVDRRGREFVTFAVDVRFGVDWRQNDVVGCVYRSGELYVQVGDDYRPATQLLGKLGEPVPGVCVAAPPPPPRS